MGQILPEGYRRARFLFAKLRRRDEDRRRRRLRHLAIFAQVPRLLLRVPQGTTDRSPAFQGWVSQAGKGRVPAQGRKNRLAPPRSGSPPRNTSPAPPGSARRLAAPPGPDCLPLAPSAAQNRLRPPPFVEEEQPVPGLDPGKDGVRASGTNPPAGQALTPRHRGGELRCGCVGAGTRSIEPERHRAPLAGVRKRRGSRSPPTFGRKPPVRGVGDPVAPSRRGDSRDSHHRRARVGPAPRRHPDARGHAEGGFNSGASHRFHPVRHAREPTLRRGHRRRGTRGRPAPSGVGQGLAGSRLAAYHPWIRAV